MKIKKGFTMRNIAGEYIVVPVGKAGEVFNGMITLNESGAFFWEQLKKDTTIEGIVKNVCDEYDVTPEIATEDVTKFVNMLRENNLLED